ncbi:LysR substrate-binding domain-containing protein [Streptomyces canus]|uniref:LysR substrate-binding domain-containing protein n=1 Tax=Streptomyces canus TaxID=58343 RepID=UPI00358FC6BA
MEAFRSRHPGSDVQFGEINGSDPFTALRTGEHDAHVLWLPVAEPDLTVGPTALAGGRVLAVAADHPLAERGTASLEDLGDNHVVDFGPAAPEYWIAAMVPTRTPLGRRIPRGPAARTFHEVLSLVASGQCVHPAGRDRRPLQQSPRHRLPPRSRRPHHPLRPHVAIHRRQPHPPHTGPDRRRPRPHLHVTADDGQLMVAAAGRQAGPRRWSGVRATSAPT